jgi:hypothetical protein
MKAKKQAATARANQPATRTARTAKTAAPAKKAAKQSPARRSATPKPATKPAAKQPAATARPAKKAAAKQPVAKSTATPKPAKKTAAKQPAAKSTATPKPAKKPAPKQPATKPTATPKPAKKPAKKPARPAVKQPPAKRSAPTKPAKQPTPASESAAPPAPAVPLAGRADWLVGPLAPLRALAEAVEDLGVHVVSDTESVAGGDALREHYAEGWSLGILWSDALWDACQARVGPLRLWATGPAVQNTMGNDLTPSLYLDPAEPGQLWYTPTPELPAALFVPLPATRAAIETALGELGPRAAPVELAEARRVRAYMGPAAHLRVPNPYSGTLEPAGPHELDRHFNFSPVATPYAWGSAHADDPLRGREPLSTIQSVIALREMREQLAESLPRFTRRTYFSHAHVAIEMHARGHYVWDITYRPARLSAPVIAAFNALTGNAYPADLPVDVAAAVHGFMFLDAAWLAAEIAGEADPGRRSALVSAALAVAADDLGEAARIGRAAISRSLADQIAVTNAAAQYNWQFLLEEVASATTDADLRAHIEAVVIEGIAPPAVNEHGEPVDLYASLGSDDDDDEQDEEQDDA